MASIRPRNMYTEEKLRPAVAAATTLGEVLTNLGLADTPKRRRYVSTQIKALGIDTTHFTHSGMLYTNEMLTAAVAESKTMVEVATKIGSTPVGGTIAHLKRRITLLGLDTSHFHQPKSTAQTRPRPTSHGFRRDGRKLVVDEEMLRAAIPSCRSIAEVIRTLGLEPSGPRHRVVREEIQRLGLDSSHFHSQVEYLRGLPNSRVLPPEKVLVFRPEQPYRRDAAILRRALASCGVPERCADCGTRPAWRGRPLTLEVDHINGDFRDNRRENLRLPCPNCRATTDTYCRKKRTA